MSDAERGRLLPPNLDDRRWQDIVEEARALIPRYAPQWTDHNPSDIGMTLIELFAWMTEGLIYRLNRVPEKNYLAFLNLLRITRDPAVPAEAMLTFTAAPGAPVVVARGRQAQTQGSETEAPVIFETDADLTVLPVNMKVALLIRKILANKYSNVSTAFTVPPARGETITIPAGQSAQLCLGFDQPTVLPIALLVRLFRPVQLEPLTLTPQATVDWRYSTGATEPGAWLAVPGVTDDTNGLQRDGIVRLTVPLNWGGQAPTGWATVSANSVADQVADPFFWIGMRINNLAATSISVGINWVLFNAVSSHNALTIVTPEAVATGNGKAFQTYPLRRRPLYKRPDTDTPYDHLQVQVSGVPWTAVEELPAGPGLVYRIDPVAGEISFGNFDPTTSAGHGSIPPSGAPIQALTYRYLEGGASGNVGAGTITTLRTAVPSIIGVTNLFSAFDGANEEPIEDTKRRAPEVLRNRYRAVTAEDYEYLAGEASRAVARVRCLSPRVHESDNGPAWTAGDPWTFAAVDRAPGNVNVIVVPDQGPLVARPEPSKELLRAVQGYLDKRRDVTARLLVLGPRYLPVRVVVQAFVWQRAIGQGLVASASDVYLQIEQKIERYLHPIHGGLDGRGWQVGQNVFIADLFKFIMPAENIGFISTLTLEAETPVYHFPPLGPGGVWSVNERPFTLATPGAWVRVADYELVCFGSRSVPKSLPV